jgi:hypothetical protein
LNTHAQTEQAQPWNCSRSTHSISRAKEHLRQEKVRRADIMLLAGHRVKPSSIPFWTARVAS